MYEKPQLNYLGQAHEVVLGMAFTGADLDGTWSGSGDGTITADLDLPEESQ